MREDIHNKLIGIVNTDTDRLKTDAIALNEALIKLLERQKELKASGEQNSKTYQDVATQIRVAKDAIKETTEQIDANIKALNLSKGSLQQNKAILESLKAQYDGLSGSQGNNSKELKNLNVQIGTLTNTISAQEEKLEKSRKVFDRHAETNKTFSSSFDALKTKSKEFENIGLGNTLEDASQGFNAMKMGLSAVKTGFTSVGGAIKTTGFGLLLLVLQSIVEYFTGTTEGAKKLKAILSGISVVVNVFKQGLSALGKILVNAFSNPVEGIKKLGQLLVDNVINRFKALLVIWDGIRHFDFKKVADGVLQAATGVTNLTTKAQEAYNNVMKGTQKEVKKNEDLNNQHHQNEKKRYVDRVDMIKKEQALRRSAQNSPAAQKLEQKTIEVTKLINTEKELYEVELTMLKYQFEQKLITQEEYEKQSLALRERYHQNLGNSIKDFAEKELTDTQKIQQDLLNGAGEILDKDADAVKKALLPGQKFEAEKKLIDDKYNFEMLKYAGNTEKMKELADEKERTLTELAKNYEQQRRDFAMQTAQQVSDAAFSILKNGIQAQSAARLKSLDTQKAAELNNSSLTATQRKVIEDKYKKKEAEEKVRAFKAEQRTSILQAVINGALAITKVTAQAGIASPFIIPGIIAQTAIQVATIAAQKAPQYAKGGLHYRSDGRGALLSGYSRTDDTNAFLRSGEAVVVSEAMRNPWARNLVSAINVAHGGRDFSTTGTGRGYAVGGIFTDGGNANRYYNQPVHDVKELANTLAYQMMNNFPPIYVDVKDVNNQQNILAQTVNRVNL